MEQMDTTIHMQEAQRRLALLGRLAHAPYDYSQLRQRAREIYVPPTILRTWLHRYQQQGLDGLLPTDWDEGEIRENLPGRLSERLVRLEETCQAEVITAEHVQALALQNQWSFRTAERWVRRYQISGWWGLTSHPHLQKVQRQKKKPPPPALGALDETALEEIFRRRELLGDLAEKPMVSRAEVQERAQTIGIAKSTLWRYLQQYRNAGLAGLAPRPRSDKYAHHGISEEITEIVRGVRFSQPGKSVQAIHQAVCQKAQALGEVEPTLWQVRQICAEISQPEQLLADRRENAFRNRYEVTRRMDVIREQSALISYQIDHTLVDVLVKDLRRKPYRTKSEMIRPWLTICIDSRSRLVMAAIFSYDRPDRHTVATAIREAILFSDTKSYGGIPHEIWVDNGQELLSHHVQQLTQALHIMLQPCAPHRPQQKGIVERFFGTLNTRLWATLPGYVDSNTVERNPHAAAVLTLQELEEQFWHFIEQYHQEVHSQTQEPPLQYWCKHCYAEPADPRLLDLLLKEATERTILKEGIAYEKRIYWHPELAPLVGTRVLIRAEPIYRAPDEIEVFLDTQWLCTALATDSPQGQVVTREEIIHAKHEQKSALQRRIKQATDAASAADRAIADLETASTTEATPPAHDQPAAEEQEQRLGQQPLAQAEPHEPTRPHDFLDIMAEQAFRKQEEHDDDSH